MRVKNTLRNSFISVISQGLVVLLSFIMRGVFIRCLGIDYLGFEGLFSSIFSLLSLAELGIGIVITFNLYKEVAVENKNEISNLVQAYKIIYRFVGISILVVGTILMFFIQYIVKDEINNMQFIRFIYMLQLFKVASTYFFSYKRAVFLAYQKEYINIIIDTLTTIVCSIINMVILLLFKDYVLYLLVNISQVMISNIYIHIKCNKYYPYLRKKCVLEKEYFKSKGILSEMKSVLIHKIGSYIFGATDNLIISKFLGIFWVGIYANYYLLISGVTIMLNKLTSPIEASLGNLIYSKENDIAQAKKINHLLELCCFFITSFSCVCFLVLFQPFISIWVGEKYLMPYKIVILLVINVYIGQIHRPMGIFRAVFGKYEQDRFYIAFGGMLNLVLSVLLCNLMGLEGVIVGTIVAHLLYWYSRAKVVHNNLLKENCLPYIKRNFCYLIITIIECILTIIICNYYFDTLNILNLIFRMIVCLIVPNLINIIIFRKNDSFIYLYNMIKSLLI